MSSILVIVESPGKISKIGHILGDSYIVDASVGHIIDLDKKNMSIDFETFEPHYKIIDGKESVVSKLKSKYKKCSDCLIAADEDREGEMIAWSLARELGIKNAKRIVFNSITKDELLKAIKNPRKIDQNIVDAQKLRRMLDRIIGYRLSPLLWKNIGAGKSSAGRVQSVVVKLVIEKENEINSFFEKDTSSEFKTSGMFLNKKNILKSQLYTTKKQLTNDSDSDESSESNSASESSTSEDDSDGSAREDDRDGSASEDEGKIKKGTLSKINKYKDVMLIMTNISKSIFKISGISKKESIQKPSPPFITLTLLQEGSRKLGFNSKRTMMAAQHLYEGGYITYMRTDSTNLSDEALKIIGDYVISKYGKEYYKKTNYITNDKGAQEAHEAIRPTDPKKTGLSNDPAHKIGSDEIRLYNLIWKRSVASQMSPAKFKIIGIQINISKLDNYYFESIIKTITFKGFLTVYDLENLEEENDDDDEIQNDDIVIPKIGTILDAKEVLTIQDYKKPPVRYNEPSLTGKIKNLNIGRPSTYPAIMIKIQDAGYVKRDDVDGIEKECKTIEWKGEKIKENTKKINLGKEKNKFVPTEMGITINNFLNTHFPEIMDYKFTADMEDNLDKVASGKLKWNKILKEFYEKFQPLVDKLNEGAKMEFIDKEAIELGVHPEYGYKIIATNAKFGAIVKMIGEGKPIIAPIKKPMTIKKITLEDALKLLEYPRLLGKYERKNVLLYKGQYGFYLKVGETDKYALKVLEEDIGEFELKDALQIIEEKNKSYIWHGQDEKNKYIVLDGQYGKYIRIIPLKGKSKGSNCKLSPSEDIKKLNLDRVKEIIKENKSKPKFKKFEKTD